MADNDDAFFERADAHIFLSNDQISEEVKAGMVSASNMYATARFNAWLSACNCETGNELAEGKQDIVEYFVTEYKKMLEENLDSYIANFDSYMKPPTKN